MREILFRGKRIGDNSWVYGGIMETFHPNFDSKNIKDFFENKSNCYCICANNRDHFVQQNTIGQYTGLTDKNGQKIFEGDILKTPTWYTNNTYPCVCIFAEEHRVESIQGFGLYHKINDSFELVQSDEWDEFEIIGNIHDNPELLGGAE